MDLNTILIILGVIALIALVVQDYGQIAVRNQNILKARIHLTALLKTVRSILFASR